MIYIIYGIPLLCIYFILDDFDLSYYDMLYLALFNMVMYCIIKGYNVRILFNYIIVSSISYIFIIFSIIYSYISFLIICSMTKIGLYPFTYWLIPTYKSLSIRKLIYVTLVTKVLYSSLILHIPNSQSDTYDSTIINSWYIILLNIIIVPIIALYTSDVIILIVYSGCLQISYIMLSYMQYQDTSFIITFIIYIYTTILLYYIVNSSLNSVFNSMLLLVVIYSFVGIPPFIGFYSKIINVNTLICLHKFYIVAIILIMSIFSCWFYINIYNSQLSQIYNYKSNCKLPRILYIYLFIFIYLIIFPDTIFYLSAHL